MEWIGFKSAGMMIGVFGKSMVVGCVVFLVSSFFVLVGCSFPLIAIDYLLLRRALLQFVFPAIHVLSLVRT